MSTRVWPFKWRRHSCRGRRSLIRAGSCKTSSNRSNCTMRGSLRGRSNSHRNWKGPKRIYLHWLSVESSRRLNFTKNYRILETLRRGWMMLEWRKNGSLTIMRGKTRRKSHSYKSSLGKGTLKLKLWEGSLVKSMIEKQFVWKKWREKLNILRIYSDNIDIYVLTFIKCTIITQNSCYLSHKACPNTVAKGIIILNSE